jgi:hypothetical protein
LRGLSILLGFLIARYFSMPIEIAMRKKFDRKEIKISLHEQA